MSASDTLILAIDVGTSRIKSAIFNSRGLPLAGTAGESVQAVKSSPDGGLEMDPAVLRRSFRAAFDQTLASPAAQGSRIAAVGVSCFWHGLLGLNDRDRPVTPVYTWADSRCRTQAAKLRDRLSEKEVHRRTGCMLRSSFWPAKLLWLKENSPSVFGSVARWVSPMEWIEADFAGKAPGSVSMASGTGLFNLATGSWDCELLDVCGVKEGRIQTPCDQGRSVPARLWRRYPALIDSLWFPAIGDGAAGNLGSGATVKGLAAVNLGTSSAVRVLDANGPGKAPFGLFHFLLDKDRCLIGGASSNAGNLWKWCLDNLRLVDGEAVEAALARRRHPRHGLTVVPFWTAERAPFWEESLPGVIHGLRQSTTALDILQACSEAASYRVALILETLEASLGEALEVVVSGGGARSRRTLRRLADVLGRPVASSGEAEASLRGAFVHALTRLGIDGPRFKPRTIVAFDPRVAEEHRRLRQRALDWQRRLPHVEMVDWN